MIMTKETTTVSSESLVYQKKYYEDNIYYKFMMLYQCVSLINDNIKDKPIFLRNNATNNKCT